MNLKNILAILKKEFSLPFLARFQSALNSLRPAERIVFGLFAALLIISALWNLVSLNESLMVSVPAFGGSLTEGVIGSAGFVNPLLAIKDTDRDLVALIYSGLMKATPEGGLALDLAESYFVSSDGLQYNFKIKDTAKFHDGVPVTADDVVYTITKAEDPNVKSPKRANFEGVGVEVINDHEVKFTLKQPYSPFLENMTLGILPKHIWKKVEPEQFPFSQFNVSPVGSGPYVIKSIKKDSTGMPLLYELEAFKNHVGGRPYIKTVNIKFYSNEDDLLSALQSGEIESVNAISPKQTDRLKSEGRRVLQTPLPRIFGVFFNQNRAPIFANKEVRAALDAALDKESLVKEILNGYGTVQNSPIPPDLLNQIGPKDPASNTITSPDSSAKQATSTDGRILKARTILERNGWKKNQGGIYEKKIKKQIIPLAFSIATGNAPELKTAADLIKKYWEKIGAEVTVTIYESGDLNQNIIRPRKYDALLFGEIIGRDLDLFAFWHSSQRNDPGLNIALYANLKADKFLEDARTESDPEKRLLDFKNFAKEVENDIPAVFVYSPDFIYVLPTKVKNAELNHVTIPSERFADINKWYVETDNVWEFMTKNPS